MSTIPEPLCSGNIRLKYESGGAVGQNGRPISCINQRTRTVTKPVRQHAAATPVTGRRATVAKMTTSGHNEPMKAVRIAELKARLSEYLRAVRRGETIAVLDRETRVAEIVPVRAPNALRIRKPAAGAPAPNRVPLPKPSTSKIDVVQVLLETRQSHR